MALQDITPMSVYDSLNAIRGKIQERQLADQQQLAAAEYARQQTLGQIQQPAQAEPQAAPEQPVESPYAADAWLAQQKKVQAAMQYSYGKMAKANLTEDQYKQAEKYVESKYDPTGEFKKPFRETELYKNAKAIAQEKDVSAQSNTIDLLKNTVDSIADISAPSNLSPKEQEDWIRQQKAAQIKTFLTSLVNSAKGTADAEQANEVLRRSPEIFSYPEMQSLKNQGLLNPTGIMSFLATREGKGVIDKFANSMQADPDGYLNKVKVIHDDLAKTYNDRIKRQIFVPTNPEIAKKEFGIVEKPLFSALSPEGVDVQVVRPQASAPAVQMSRAQMAAEILKQRAAARASQPAVPQNIPVQQDFTGQGSF